MAASVRRYRAEGYSAFQLKSGSDVETDVARIRAVASELVPGDVLVADAGGWTQHQAVCIAAAVRDVNVYIEQPCTSYEECLAVRRHTNRPFILDEVVDDLRAVVRGYSDQATDVINLKISKVGGLSKARQIRDLCVSLGIAMTIEDFGDGDGTLHWRIRVGKFRRPTKTHGRRPRHFPHGHRRIGTPLGSCHVERLFIA